MAIAKKSSGAGTLFTRKYGEGDFLLERRKEIIARVGGSIASLLRHFPYKTNHERGFKRINIDSGRPLLTRLFPTLIYREGKRENRGEKPGKFPNYPAYMRFNYRVTLRSFKLPTPKPEEEKKQMGYDYLRIFQLLATFWSSCTWFTTLTKHRFIADPRFTITDIFLLSRRAAGFPCRLTETIGRGWKV